MKQYLVLALIVILGLAIFLGGFFISKERAFDENIQLKQENENLRAEIQKSQNLNFALPSVADGYVKAEVFSTYPFNVKNQITVDAGQAQGIAKLMPAVFGENILLGQVTDVSNKYSVIQTIFDPNWQLPVRIGDKQINGLLQGGSEPKITFIEKDKEVNAGDVVYSAKQGFPLNLKVGEISEIRESAPGMFKEAVLKAPFNVADLREIEILTK